MGLFSSNRTLGVDVGTSKLKVVELKKAKGGKAELSTYGMAPLPRDLVRKTSDDIVNDLTQALELILEKANMKAKKAYASLPGFSVFSQEIRLPMLPDKEIEAAVREEAPKLLKRELSGMVLDWEVLNDDYPVASQQELEQQQKELRVLLTAAPEPLVQRYTAIFQQAGLQLVSLETEAMALTRSLVGRDRAPTLLIDLGETATDVIRIDGAMPRFTHTFDIGGFAMTQAIAQSLGIDEKEAEQMKKDVGIGDGSSVPHTLQPVLSALLEEIKKVRTAFEQKRGQSVERVLLAGGAAKLPGFATWLEAQLDVPTVLANPFARVLHPNELNDLLETVGPDLGVAIGLAMKEIY